MIDFETLTRPTSPNTYLVADQKLCPNATADSAPVILDWPMDIVITAWQRVVMSQPRTRETDRDETLAKYEYVQKSLLMRFPDTLTIQFFAVSNEMATKVIAYSASKVGYSDMGVNRKRVKRWISQLERELRYPN